MSKKIGLSKTPPTSDARQLGTTRPKEKKAAKGKKIVASDSPEPADVTMSSAQPSVSSVDVTEKTSPDAQKVVDIDIEPVLHSSSSESPQTSMTTSQESATVSRRQKMTLTLKGLSKNSKNAFYTGAKNVQRFSVSSFVDGKAPASFDVDDNVFAGPKAKMTKEERKAANAAKPKPTIAELIAKREASLAKLRAKAEAPVQASL